MFLIGVDCATKANKTGLAFGRLDREKLVICSAERGRGEKWESGVDGKVKQWIAEARKENRKVLLALDTPLGWPRFFGKTLMPHEAGCTLPKSADCMFDRETDRWIHRWVNENSGNKPFSVGADKIARTTHAALSFLGRLRDQMGPIPLAWEPEDVEDVAVIEVYPAATLRARNFPSEGYKNNTERAKNVRADIIGRLNNEMELDENIQSKMRDGDDVLDAVICVLAAKDFANAKADADSKCKVISPEDANINRKSAEKEGWIWVKTTLPAPPRNG